MTTVEGLVNGLNLLISITNNRVNVCATIDGLYAITDCIYSDDGEYVDPLTAAQVRVMKSWGWMGNPENLGEFIFKC